MAEFSPRQARPVRRPDMIRPHTVADVTQGTAEQLITLRMQLMHGVNINDPQYFRFPTYQRLQLCFAGWPL